MNRTELLKVAKPILFNTEMVRAILDGRKSCTRRVINPRYRDDEYGFNVVTNNSTGERWIEKYNEDEGDFEVTRYVNPPYQVGDILYVRETWGTYEDNWIDACYYLYRADYPDGAKTYEFGGKITCDLPKWRPSIHMPKEAARIFLRVTGVRVERLRDITVDGVKQEGVTLTYPLIKMIDSEHLKKFIKLWDSTIKKKDISLYGWDANPWVWVYEFEKEAQE